MTEKLISISLRTRSHNPDTAIAIVLIAYWIKSSDIKTRLEPILSSIGDDAWSEIQSLKDVPIGKVVVRSTNLYGHFLNCMDNDPVSKFMVDLPEMQKVRWFFEARLHGEIGRLVKKTHWWLMNEKRIKKMMNNMKKVREVVEQ